MRKITAHPNFKLGADTKSSIVKECRITKKKKKTCDQPLLENVYKDVLVPSLKKLQV